MLRTKKDEGDINSAAYPLKLFTFIFLVLQGLNVYEWVWQIQPTLNTIYLVYAMVSTAFKFDLTVLGMIIAVKYESQIVNKTENGAIPKPIKTTIWFFYGLGGVFTLVQFVVTTIAMHQYTFSVLWTLLLFMVGQGMLEIICFCMMLFFGILLVKQYEGKATQKLTETTTMK